MDLSFEIWLTGAVVIGMTVVLIMEKFEVEQVIFSALMILIIGEVVTLKGSFCRFFQRRDVDHCPDVYCCRCAQQYRNAEADQSPDFWTAGNQYNPKIGPPDVAGFRVVRFYQ